MSVFRSFEQAVERAEAARRTWVAANCALEEAKAPIQSFGEQSASALSSVLTRFAEAGLLPEIDPHFHTRDYLCPYTNYIAADRIEMRGLNARAGGDARMDTKGLRVAEEIVAAANTHKIPIVHEMNGGQNIQVSPHVKERENAPEILLRALAAYAEGRHKPEMAGVARAAAEEMKTAVAAYREIG
ncbi:MAG: hypothetical protein AB7L92_08445 [Alphaproteobacteria bacterium]